MTNSQIIRESIDAWFRRRLFIPAFEMKNDNLKDLINKIKNHNPVILVVKYLINMAHVNSLV
jgi:hypothetical protein